MLIRLATLTDGMQRAKGRGGDASALRLIAGAEPAEGMSRSRPRGNGNSVYRAAPLVTVSAPLSGHEIDCENGVQ